jgi:maleate isomerase
MKTTSILSPFQVESHLVGGHIGLIVLDCDQTTERDFMNMRPDGVCFYTSRTPYSEENTIENLMAVGDRLGDAASLILPAEKLDAIAYSCTSGTVALGFDEIANRINAVRKDVPVVTPMTAAFKAFDHMKISNLSLLTPYRIEVADMMTSYISDHGYHILNSTSFLLQHSSELQRLSLDSIVSGAIEVCHEDADALFISCTGLRSVELVARLEKRLKKPVFTSNQCMFWECLRYSGYTGTIDGYGSLMRNIH